MARLIAVCGATGTQGGAVVSRMLKEGWQVRAITRDVNSDKAKTLHAKGVKLASASYDDVEGMVRAFKGATALYALTQFFNHLSEHGPEGASCKETEEVINIATAASRTPTLQHFVLNALPAGEKLGGPGYFVPHLDSKDRAIDQIKRSMPELAKKTTFMMLGLFSQSFWAGPFMKPFEMPTNPGKYALLMAIAPDAKIPWSGEVVNNVGVFVNAILSRPEVSLPAKHTLVATDWLTMPEALSQWSEVTGKPATMASMTLEDFEGLWGPRGRELALQYRLHEKESDFRKPYLASFVTPEALGIRNQELLDHKQALEANKEKLL